MPISGTTRLAGLFAQPAQHSQSPLIHNTAFDLLGIDAVYLAFDIDLNKTPAAIHTIKTLNMIGVNLSMPNKQIAKKLVDEYSETVALVGAVNTIVNEQGRLIGHNTDGIGLMKSLEKMDCQLLGMKMTVIGLGGAALSIIAQAALDGAAVIHVFNRKSQRAQQKLPILRNIANQTNCAIHFHYLSEQHYLQQAIDQSDVLVNATNVGMGEYLEEMPIPMNSQLPNTLKVVDIIYHPAETKFLAFAKKQGCQTDNGLNMLIYQAAAAFELWTKQNMPIEAIREKLKN